MTSWNRKASLAAEFQPSSCPHKTLRNLVLQTQRKIECDTKKRELLKNPTKIEQIQEKKLLTMLPAFGRQHRRYIIPQTVTHSLVLLKMGKIISRNMLSWLELLISRYYLYQWCTVKQISDNEIYLLIKYVKSVLWREAKRLSYTEDARCLKVKEKHAKKRYAEVLLDTNNDVSIEVTPKWIAYTTSNNISVGHSFHTVRYHRYRYRQYHFRNCSWIVGSGVATPFNSLVWINLKSSVQEKNFKRYIIDYLQHNSSQRYDSNHTFIVRYSPWF